MILQKTKAVFLCAFIGFVWCNAAMATGDQNDSNAVVALKEPACFVIETGSKLEKSGDDIMVDKPKDAFRWQHDAYNNNYNGCGLTGYTGLDYHTIAQLSVMPAWRSQVGNRGFYKAGLCVLPDGTLLASPVDMLAPKVQSPFPGRIGKQSSPVKLHRSTDGGRSWQPMEHTPLAGKEGSLTCLDNGVLLFTSESLDGVCFSEDGGKIWQTVDFNTPRDDQYQSVSTVRSPIVHPDGTISFMSCIGIKGSTQTIMPQGYNSPKCRAWLIHSTDGGRTWNDRTEIETWDDTFPLFVEADFERMPDGRILAVSRFVELHPLKDKPLPYPLGKIPNDHSAGHMVLLESNDEGKTWSEPREFLQYSEVHGQLTLLKDGRLLCTYTNYHLPFGAAAVVSYDYGKTWDFEHPIQLAISPPVGSAWPTTRQLKDGTLVTIYAMNPYYIEPPESGRTVCHTVRWKLPILHKN